MSRHWRARGQGGYRLSVHPHPSGPWLVQAGGKVLVVDPQAGRALLPLAGQAVRPSGFPPARARGLPLRVTILPAPVVRALAAALAPLASTAGLSFVAAGGLVAVACLRPWAVSGGFSLPALLMFAAGACLHELGHAAALSRAGYRPGAVGVGVFVILPVLFADVSAVRLLPRGARVRVDLAGPAFQAGAAGLLAVAAAAAPRPLAAAAGTAAVATLAALAWALLPLARSDGTWALRDALGPEGGAAAGAAAGPAAGPAARRLEAVLATIRAVVTTAACCLLPPRVAALVVAAAAAAGWHLPPPARIALALVLQLGALAALAAAAVRIRRRRRRAAVPDAPQPP